MSCLQTWIACVPVLGVVDHKALGRKRKTSETQERALLSSTVSHEVKLLRVSEVKTSLCFSQIWVGEASCLCIWKRSYQSEFQAKSPHVWLFRGYQSRYPENWFWVRVESLELKVRREILKLCKILLRLQVSKFCPRLVPACSHWTRHRRLCPWRQLANFQACLHFQLQTICPAGENHSSGLMSWEIKFSWPPFVPQVPWTGLRGWESSFLIHITAAGLRIQPQMEKRKIDRNFSLCLATTSMHNQLVLVD